MVWWWGERGFSGIKGSIGEGSGGGGGEGWIGCIGGGDRWHVVVAVGVTAMAGLALAATIVMSSRRGSLKSPWSRRKRKHVLSPEHWKRLFTPEGKFFDGGARLLKKVRSGGVDQSIRSEVWPFLLGVYELNSSEDERNAVRKKKRKEYKKLRKRCQCLLKFCYDAGKLLKEIDEVECEHHSHGHCNNVDIIHDKASSTSNIESSLGGASDDKSGITYSDEFEDENEIARVSLTSQISLAHSSSEEKNKCEITKDGLETGETESSDSDSSEESLPVSMAFTKDLFEVNASAFSKSAQTVEDFTTWQRIIRLDAVRANAEWVIYAPAQAAVSDKKALEHAESVGLKDYDHLEPFMIYHAARLVAVLEAYAIYDPDIGYCQGMSDLLSPILSVMGEDDEAFWCFAGFMKKARHNFRLDEVGIRRQLSIVSKIIKFKDPHLYKHLEKLQAEDCFFVYRMVVVLFRRELNFEQTACLWEVMWADQTAIRAGVGKSAWARIRLRAPPTDDLLLYAIAACVLQRRKLIIERYSSMDEILRECNNMAGNLDVWKLLDDAHDLVVTLHDKIS